MFELLKLSGHAQHEQNIILILETSFKTNPAAFSLPGTIRGINRYFEDHYFPGIIRDVISEVQ